MCSCFHKCKCQNIIFDQINQEPVWFNEFIAFLVSGRKFYCVHLLFKCLPQVIHVGVSLDVRIAGNASGFLHSIKRSLTVVGQLNIKRKSSSENTLMKEQINCTGHIDIVKIS